VHRRRHGHRDGGGGIIDARIAGSALEAVTEHARDALPVECCGVLIGTDAAVIEAVRVKNVADDPNQFLLDPQGHINALRAARARGLDVIGFYHSHPHSEPEPSPTDIANASYPGHLYLIVRPLPAGGQARLFRYVGDRFEELSFTVAGSPPQGK
jgi:desampylase